MILAQDHLTWKHTSTALSGQIDLLINGWSTGRASLGARLRTACGFAFGALVPARLRAFGFRRRF